MKVECKVGDVCNETADAIISTANVFLQMTGGVNGEILVRGGLPVQQELNEYKKSRGISYVDQGTVIETGPGPLQTERILHTVAVDCWYDSSPEVVEGVVSKALTLAAEAGAKTVAMPALATGYGHLTMPEFARGLRAALLKQYGSIEELRVVLTNEKNLSEVKSVLNETKNSARH